MFQREKYYMKDKKAEVYEVIEDDGGTIWWRPITPAPMWCYSRLVSESKKYEAGIVGESISRDFVFNYNAKIAVDAVIKYKDVWYQAERVDTQDDYNGDMHVTVRDCPTGDTPRKNRILPYGQDPE